MRTNVPSPLVILRIYKKIANMLYNKCTPVRSSPTSLCPRLPWTCLALHSIFLLHLVNSYSPPCLFLYFSVFKTIFKFSQPKSGLSASTAHSRCAQDFPCSTIVRRRARGSGTLLQSVKIPTLQTRVTLGKSLNLGKAVST